MTYFSTLLAKLPTLLTLASKTGFVISILIDSIQTLSKEKASGKIVYIQNKKRNKQKEEAINSNNNNKKRKRKRKRIKKKKHIKGATEK